MALTNARLSSLTLGAVLIDCDLLAVGNRQAFQSDGGDDMGVGAKFVECQMIDLPGLVEAELDGMM